MRIKKFLGFHLHDIIRRSSPIKNIVLHCRYHKDEINETSYQGRNACHWAAKMNRPDFLTLFAQLGGNLTARDVDSKTPFDLATTEETKNTITKLIAESINPQKLSDNTPLLNSNINTDRNQDSSGVLNRIKEIKSTVAKALSPQREDIHSRSTFESLSLRAPHKSFEHHPKTKSPPLSPRDKDKAKPKQITSTKMRGILKTTRTAREKYDPRSTQIDINHQSNKKIFKQEMDNPFTGSRTTYVPMPSVANNSNNDRLIPPQNPSSSTVKIAATLADSSSTNTISTGSIFVPMPRLNRDVLDNAISPATLEQKDSNQKQIRFAGFSDQLSAKDLQNTNHNREHENQDKPLTLPNETNQLAVNNNISSLEPPKTEPHSNTQESTDTSNENSTGQSDTSKYLRNSFFYSAEELITIFKSDNLDAFKQKKNNPNQKLSGFGRPYIIQAFLSNAGRIFIYLLQQGANLDSLTNSGKQLSDYISEENKKERIGFLNQVKEGISNKVCTSRITNDRDRLDKLEQAFMLKLHNNGLNKTFKRQATFCDKDILISISISKQHQIRMEFVQTIYELCLGSNNEAVKERIDKKEINQDENTIFNLDLIKKYIIFLLTKNEPHVIVAVMQDLFPHLLIQQQLITYFIIKEIILWDKFHHCYRNKQFCEVTLPTFIKTTTPPDKLDGYSLHLNEMIKLQNKINSPLIRANDQIDIIIAKFNDKNTNESPNDFKLFAADLTKSVHLYFRTFKLNEWLNQAWSKENKRNIAPTLVEITSLFNKISDYVVISILESANTKERFSTIEFYINTLNELINGQNRPCDLQSAMAISSALEKSILKKYLKLFKTHNSKTFQLWENAQLILDNTDYYKSHRTLMDDTSRMTYPFTGLFSTDLTLKAENANLNTKALNEASVYQKIIQIQDKALSIPISNFNNNLLYVLHNQQEMTDEDFELIEMKNNTLPINLDSTLTIPHLINLIDVYCTKKLLLKVTFIQNLTKKESEGLAALESVFTWIKEEIPVKKINSIEIDKLVKKMEQLPKTNKERIELHRTILMKWHALQLAKVRAANNQKPVSGNIQEPIKKEKEHAEDDGCAQLKI